MENILHKNIKTKKKHIDKNIPENSNKVKAEIIYR